MASLTPAQEKVYLAVRHIERKGKGSIFAYAKNIAAFLSGDNENPNAWFYQLDKELFGSMPKMNTVQAIIVASGLVDMGFLFKESIDGNIRYSLTGTDPYAEDRYSFSWNLSEQKKKTFARIKHLIDHYFGHLVVCHEEPKFVGYKRLPENDYEGYWFWITNSKTNPSAFSLRIRRSPEHKSFDDAFDFNHKNITDALVAIKDVVDPYGRIEIESKSEDINQSLEPISFNSFIAEAESKDICINGINDPVSALLALGDSTPFYYRDDTQYAPSSCSRLVEDKKNFDFSMAKWKLVAWTVLKDNNRKIQEALVILKKTKSIWMLVSIPNHRVICLSKAPFFIFDGDKQYDSEKLLSFIF